MMTSTYREAASNESRRHTEGLRNSYDPSALIVIDTEANSVVKTVHFSTYIDHIAFNPANNQIYATAQVNGHVKVIDTETFTYTKIPIRGYPTGIAANPATNRVYVTSQGFEGNDKLFVIDGATNAVAGPYDVDGVAGEILVNPTTNRIYVVSNPKTRVFNGSDHAVLSDLSGITVVGADPVHNIIYARTARDEAPTFEALDGNTHSLLGSFGFKATAGGIATNPAINRIYVSLTSEDQLAVVDSSTYTEMCRLAVSDLPYLLTNDPIAGRVYVCHAGSSPVLGILAERSLEADIPDEFSDTFDSSTLDPSWTVASGKDGYSLSDNPGHLRIRGAEESGSKPRVLLTRRIRGEHWSLEVKVAHFTGTSGGSRTFAFGVIFGTVPLPGAFSKPDSRTPHAVYVYRSRDDWNDCCPGETRQQFVERGRTASYSSLPPNAADAYFWLIKRNGRTITIERSDDGMNFNLVGAHTFGPQIDGVIQYLGISCDTYANKYMHADYDYVRLNKMPTNQR
jgi:YVTN family beta-propeller protein